MSSGLEAVLMTIAKKFPNPDNISSWPKGAAWLPHANKILRWPFFGTATDSAALVTLHLKVGCYYFRTGRWSVARTTTEAACNIRAQVLGPFEPTTLEAKDQFIQILRQLGNITWPKQQPARS